jgi:hypothetical protein
MLDATRRRLFGAVMTAILGVAPLLSFAPALLRSGGASAGAVVPDGREVGFSMYGDFIGQPVSVINANLDRAQAVGATWVRVPFNWSTLEMHGKGQYNWTPADNVANAAAARGLKILADVAYTPSWARAAGTVSTNPPTKMSDYSDFLKAAVAHYAPLGVHAWEIWNEPNITAMWAPKPSIPLYTSMLKVAYPAIKLVDPSATVVTGGFSPGYDATDGSQYLPLTFLKGIYANGGKGFFDAVGHHPENFPYPVTKVASWNAFQQSNDLYAYMSSMGDGSKTIWGTEFGYPTGTGSKAVSESSQGDLIAQGLEVWKGLSFHGPIFMYSLQDEGTDLNNTYSNMGLIHYDGTLKPGYTRVMQALRAPQHVAATTSTGSVNVTWDAPGYDYGTAITGYKVSASPGGASVTVGAAARSATVPVADGTVYTLSVQPIQGGVPGVTSLSSNDVMPDVPTIVPGSGSVAEGKAGTTTTMNIPVTLSKASTQTVSVKYQTMSYPPSYNAAAGYDYSTTSGTVTFAPGVTKASIPVTVIGDNTVEPSESFLVVLSSATNGVIGGYGGLGVGTVVNDD